MNYAEERLSVCKRLARMGRGRPLTELLRPDGTLLRFRLGTSLADLRVPYHIMRDVVETVRRAVFDLLLLLVERHKESLAPDAQRRLTAFPGFDAAVLRPIAWRPPPSATRASVRAAFLEAPEQHPFLDAGLFASWISSGRPGRALCAVVAGALSRARSEAMEAGGAEPTPYLVELMLRAKVEKTLEDLWREAALDDAELRSFRAAVATGLSVAMRLSAREANCAEHSPDGALLAAPWSLLAWVGGKAGVAQSGLLAYGTPFEAQVPHIEEHATRLVSGHDPEVVAREVAKSLAKDKEHHRRAQRVVVTAEMRRHLLALARRAEVLAASGLSLSLPVPVDDLLSRTQALSAALGDEERRTALADWLDAFARSVRDDELRSAAQAAVVLARSWRDEAPAAAMPENIVTLLYGRAAAALAADLAIERGLQVAMQVLLERRGDEVEGGETAEYEAGRLYLLSMDGRALLTQRPAAVTMGHLFVDVKDFTRRTAQLKEAVTADLLRREFYQPVLTAAGEHFQGAAHLSDRGGVYLNNLLGDAVSLSGNVVALIDIARRVRQALDSYAQRLEEEANKSPEVARRVRAVEERFDAQRKALGGALAQVNRELAASPATARPALQARIRELEAEAMRIERRKAEELARMRGERLEAGVFISFGEAPEVATIDDAVFGLVKVSVGEKINESARGTSRNPAVRALAEAAMDEIRAERGRTDLVCPLDVFVGPSPVLSVPPALALSAMAAIAAGDRKKAERSYVEAVRRHLEDAARAPQMGDIYNAGIAVSDEAVRAYTRQRTGARFLFPEIAVNDLHGALYERFVFPQRTLRLVLGVDPDTRALNDLFVYAGHAMFRGFEKVGGLAVYELIPPRSQFFQLFAIHQLPLIPG